MKKYIALICLTFAVCVGLSAQSTTPRFGIGVNQDNTGRTLTYNWVTVTEVAGYDSININPHAWLSNYKVSVTNDSIRFANPVITRSYAGDNVRLIITGTSGKVVSFATYGTSNWVVNKTSNTTGEIILSTKGKAVIEFVFDGAKWIESGRSVE